MSPGPVLSLRILIQGNHSWSRIKFRKAQGKALANKYLLHCLRCGSDPEGEKAWAWPLTLELGFRKLLSSPPGKKEGGLSDSLSTLQGHTHLSTTSCSFCCKRRKHGQAGSRNPVCEHDLNTFHCIQLCGCRLHNKGLDKAFWAVLSHTHSSSTLLTYTKMNQSLPLPCGEPGSS